MGKLLATTTITDPCGGCCGSLGLTWECESLTGTASLVGITGYKPSDNSQTDLDPEAPWQYRKWQYRELSGWDRSSNRNDNCEGSCASTTDTFYYGAYEDGVSFADNDRYEGCPPVLVATGPVTGVGSPRSTDTPNPCSGANRFTMAYTLTTATRGVCAGRECEENFPFWNVVSSDAAEELTEEQYLYDALEASGTAEEGESCCTYLADADLVPPESVDDISLTGTAVRVTITLLNSEPGVDYAVTVTLSQENPQPEDPEEPPVPPTITEVVLTINGDAPVAYYYPPLPVPEDFPICVIDVVLGGEVEE